MKTDDLINTLSEDAKPPPPLWRNASLFPVLGALIAFAMFLATLGIRPDLIAAIETSAFQIKMLVFVTIAALTGADFYRLMRPTAWQVPIGVYGAGGILIIAAIVQLATVPSGQWNAYLFSGDWQACVRWVPLLAIAPLAAALIAMRSGAPASPMLAGLSAGAAAAAISAMIYATHCPADTPIFYATWYSIGAVFVLAAGALAGRTTLRW